MATEYCDRYTFYQVYGHYPPEDGSYDPAVDQHAVAMGVNPVEVETKVVAASDEDKPKPKQSRVAETK